LNETNWLARLASEKKPLPLLSFPGIRFLGDVNVRQMVCDSDLQARCMKAVADRVDAAAAVSFMDLSVEAEAFGARVLFFDDDVPAVCGSLVTDEDEAQALPIPAVGAGRTGVYIDAIRMAKERITDRPVLAGAIGPFSLAGRLVDVSEAMYLCYDEPELLHTLLEKCVRFSIAYIRALRDAGADGVVLAEPLAGLISPDQEREFSAPYVRRIAEAVQDEQFPVIYHNCGNYAYLMTDSFRENGCAAYHFGDSVDLKRMLDQMGVDKIVMGNISPSSEFRGGTPDTMRQAVRELMERCGGYRNFVPSSGCDVPPGSPWENIEAFFDAFSRGLT
jgi:uroporphyrinogen decarboxylase